MVLESNCTISPLDLERFASVVNATCGPADGRRPASRVLDRSATLLLVLEVFKFLTGEGVALMGGVYSRLSASERNRIDERRNRDGLGVREIARRINRSPSTIGREPKRGLWFASDENESHRPCRPRRLRAGAWTSLPFHSALTARRRADLRKRESRKPPRMACDRLHARARPPGRNATSTGTSRPWRTSTAPGTTAPNPPCMHSWTNRWACPPTMPAPCSSCRRGGNENGNGGIRRYLPRKTIFEELADDELQAIVQEINDTPMELLGYETPNEVW